MNCRRVPCKRPPRGAGVGGETKKERKGGKGRAARRKGRARARKGHESSWTRLHPSLLETGAPSLLGAPPLGRGQGRGKRRRRPPWPSLAPHEGLVGAVEFLSGSGSHSNGRIAPSEGADCGAPARSTAGFHAPTAGGASSG